VEQVVVVGVQHEHDNRNRKKKGNITAQVLMYVCVCSYVLTRN